MLRPAVVGPRAIMEGRITAVEPQERHGGRRVNVFVEGRYAFSLALELADSLRVGQFVSRSDVERLLDADQLQRATDAALRFLASRPRSEREVRARLARGGYAEPVVEQVLEKLRRYGLVDDAAFARYWIEQRQTFRPRGARLLRQELRLKGVDAEVAAESLVTVEDETEDAYRAGAKKAVGLRGLDRRQFREKLGAFLARRGFDWETIRSAVGRLERELLDADS